MTKQKLLEARDKFQDAAIKILDKELGYDKVCGFRWTISGQIFDQLVAPILQKEKP